jgi:hypothetical protein
LDNFSRSFWRSSCRGGVCRLLLLIKFLASVPLAVLTAGVAATLVLALEGSLGVMLLGWLFERFDVSAEQAGQASRLSPFSNRRSFDMSRRDLIRSKRALWMRVRKADSIFWDTTSKEATEGLGQKQDSSGDDTPKTGRRTASAEPDHCGC